MDDIIVIAPQHAELRKLMVKHIENLGYKFSRSGGEFLSNNITFNKENKTYYFGLIENTDYDFLIDYLDLDKFFEMKKEYDK